MQKQICKSKMLKYSSEPVIYVWNGSNWSTRIDPSIHLYRPLCMLALVEFFLQLFDAFLRPRAQKICPFVAIEYDNGNENSNMQIENKETWNDLSVIHLYLLLPVDLFCCHIMI